MYMYMYVSLYMHKMIDWKFYFCVSSEVSTSEHVQGKDIYLRSPISNSKILFVSEALGRNSFANWSKSKKKKNENLYDLTGMNNFSSIYGCRSYNLDLNLDIHYETLKFALLMVIHKINKTKQKLKIVSVNKIKNMNDHYWVRMKVQLRDIEIPSVVPF